MHQERDADGLAHVRGQIHRLVNPGLAVATLMENRLKDVAVAVGDVSVLLVRRPKRCHKVSATSLFLVAAHRSKDSTNQTFRVSSSRTAIARL